MMYKHSASGSIVGTMMPDREHPPLRLGTRKCECEHTGDGEASQHSGIDGLGACCYKACPCTKFTPRTQR